MFAADTVVTDPFQIIDRAIAQYNPVYMFVLFSGGNDSLVTTHIATQHPFFKENGAVVHINTGIGIPETNQFARETAERNGWNFLEYKATEHTKADGTPDPQIYEDMILRWGFPGATMHQRMYTRLKERQLRRAKRDLKLKRGRKVLIVTGVRKQESLRRMGTVASTIDPRGNEVWVNPCYYWTKADCNNYISANNLERNRVSQQICMSGECLCGAFAKKGELELIEACYPETGERLRKLEQKVQAAGFPWGWEDQPPHWWGQYKQGQQFIPGMEEQFLPMCASCDYKKNSLDSVIRKPVKWYFETPKGRINCDYYTQELDLAIEQFKQEHPDLEILGGGINI